MVIDAQKQIYEMEMDIAKEEIRQAAVAQGIGDKVKSSRRKDFIIVRLESEAF